MLNLGNVNEHMININYNYEKPIIQTKQKCHAFVTDAIMLYWTWFSEETGTRKEQ